MGKKIFKTTIGFIITLGFAFPALSIPIFPPVDAGIFTSEILAATVLLDTEGVPLETPTQSVSLVLDDGTQLACAAVSPGDTVIVTYTVPNNLGRQRAKALAHSEVACIGFVSLPSDNEAFYFFAPPQKPNLNNPVKP